MLWASGLTSPCLCFLICNITIPQRCVRSTALTGVSNFVYNKFLKNLSDRELMESIDRIYKSDVEGGKESKIKTQFSSLGSYMDGGVTQTRK